MFIIYCSSSGSSATTWPLGVTTAALVVLTQIDLFAALFRFGFNLRTELLACLFFSKLDDDEFFVFFRFKNDFMNYRT